MLKKNISTIWLYISCVIFPLAVAIPLNFVTMDGEFSQWIIPYFSGAENTRWFSQWEYSVSDQNDFLAASRREKVFWNFKKIQEGDLNQYNFNDVGYLYIVKVARFLMPSLPGILSVMILQAVFHILSCLFVLFCLGKLKIPIPYGFAFIILYAANPLILYYVTSPFYFSWQIVPSLLWVWYFSSKPSRSSVYFLIVVLLVGILSFLLRPTTIIPTASLAAFIVFNKNRKALLFLLPLATIAVFAALPKVASKLPWHPMYVGLGAYGGFGVPSLDDNVSYDVFFQKTGREVVTSVPGYSWNDDGFRKDFYAFIKNEYLKKIVSNPWLAIRNSFYNMLQSIGIGHRPYNTWINAVSALIGTLLIGFYILTGNKSMLAALLLTSVGYAAYFPPIPAYNFGMYVLNVFGVVYGLEGISYRKIEGGRDHRLKLLAGGDNGEGEHNA